MILPLLAAALAVAAPAAAPAARPAAAEGRVAAHVTDRDAAPLFAKGPLASALADFEAERWSEARPRDVSINQICEIT